MFIIFVTVYRNNFMWICCVITMEAKYSLTQSFTDNPMSQRDNFYTLLLTKYKKLCPEDSW